jgi:hypothetical protein
MFDIFGNSFFERYTTPAAYATASIGNKHFIEKFPCHGPLNCSSCGTLPGAFVRIRGRGRCCSPMVMVNQLASKSSQYYSDFVVFPSFQITQIPKRWLRPGFFTAF